MWGGSAQSGSGANLKISAFVLVMSTVLESIRRVFQAHQARLAAVAAAPGAGPVSGSLREISATCLSKQIQDLVKSQYTAIGTSRRLTSVAWAPVLFVVRGLAPRATVSYDHSS
jgi:hypothetical protein